MSQMAQQYEDTEKKKNLGFAQTVRRYQLQVPIIRIHFHSYRIHRNNGSFQDCCALAVVGLMEEKWMANERGKEPREWTSPDHLLMPTLGDLTAQQLFSAFQGNRALILFSHQATLYSRKAWTHQQVQSASNFIFAICDHSISFARDRFVNRHTTHF